MPETFRVGITRDFLKADGTLAFGNIGLDLLDRAPGITREFLESHSPELQPEQIRGFDALLVLAPSVTAATLTGADRLALVARFGVGYDNVDIVACTRAGVLVTITPDGVRRPVATSVLAYLLALSLRMFDKDRLTRAGRWADKLSRPIMPRLRPVKPVPIKSKISVGDGLWETATATVCRARRSESPGYPTASA
jgi:D-3-phosphoglycerate dehydrogenase